MSFPKDEHVISVFIDASEKFWAVVVTQTQMNQLEKEIEQQEHKPMAFPGVILREHKKLDHI